MWKGHAVASALRFAHRGVRFGMGSDTTSADGFKNLMAAEACQRIEHALPVADFSVENILNCPVYVPCYLSASVD